MNLICHNDLGCTQNLIVLYPNREDLKSPLLEADAPGDRQRVLHFRRVDTIGNAKN